MTAGAYCQVRDKLKHTAFMGLNQDVLLPVFYALSDDPDDIQPKYWRGFRLLGIDGTDLALPNALDVLAAFGGRSFKIAKS